MRPLLYILFCCLPFAGRGQVITTVAGNGNGGYSGDSGLATSAGIGYVSDLAFDSQGNYYFVNRLKHRVLKVNTSGIITCYAGNGTAGFNGDGGLANLANLDNPTGISIDTADNLFIADSYNHRIRKVDLPTGIITTIAGNGNVGYTGDGGPALLASFSLPTHVKADRLGYIYVSDAFNHVIRKIEANGNISTFAGNGTSGFSGDSGLATAAQLTSPGGICLDSIGNLYITLLGDARIRKVDVATNIINTIAGTGTGIYNGDGISALAANLGPAAVVFDNVGNLIIADNLNNRIRYIDLAGIIHTIAGDGAAAYSGDGDSAIHASLYDPEGVGLDSCGNLFITDKSNRRIRKVTFNDSCGTLSSKQPIPLTFTLSPNPATTELTIFSSNKLKEITITNTLGQQLHHQTCNTEKLTLNLEHLPPGLYYLHLTDTHNTHRTEKLIKQ